MRAPWSGIRLVGGAGNTGFSMGASTISLRIKERKAQTHQLQKVRVMMWPDRSPNPFIALLIENLGAGYEVIGFNFRTALIGRYQILHVHWPEVLVHSPSGLKRLVKLFLLITLIVLNKVRRIPHLWTVHNERPHEPTTPIEEFGLRLWRSSCARRVYLTRAGLQRATDSKGVLIVHGDYAHLRDTNRAHITQPVPGQLITFGLLRRYKSLELLIESVRHLPKQTGISLVLAGQPMPEEYALALVKASAEDRRISVVPKHQTDAELVRKITSSEFVVIPYARIYNSGTALLALTLGRPVITTDSPTMRELQDEVGPEWVQCLRQELSSESLLDAVNRLRSHDRPELPRFQNRDWSIVGTQYAELYNRLIFRSLSNRSTEEPGC